MFAMTTTKSEIFRQSKRDFPKVLECIEEGLLNILNINDLQEAIVKLREEWRIIRNERLSRKEELASMGNDAAAIRHDRAYRALRKRQHYFTVRITHLERSLNRKRAHEKKD
jgi:hypothetical protein